MTKNITDEEYQVCEMFFEDGMDEEEIAESIGYTELQVRQILTTCGATALNFMYYKYDEE